MAKQTKTSKASERSVEDIEADLQLPSSSDEELSVEEGSDVSADELSEESDEDVADDDDEEEDNEDDDEEEEEEQEDAQEEEIIPITHKITKSKASASTSSNSKSKKAKGVIYIGRIPEGFQETEMTKYFDQFGDITRLRLSRNKKTGKSKHYGFIEFAESEVAKIAADTMNNYLLFGHLLKCHVVPKEDVHDDLFKGSGSTYKAIPWAKISKNKHDSPKSKQQWERLAKKHQQTQKAKKDKLRAKGFDFDFGVSNTV